MTREEIRIEMMAGRLGRDALENFDAQQATAKVSSDVRNTRPELGPVKSWASGLGKRAQDVFRDGRAVPSWVLKDEEATGAKYFFVEERGWSGWTRGRPAKPDELVEREKRTGEPWRWDYQKQMWRPLADMVPMINVPPDMKAICSRHGIEEGSSGYPVLNEKTGNWEWPEHYAGKGRGYGEREDAKRRDLPAAYWEDDKYHVIRPGQSIPESYGAQVSDGAGSVHDPANSKTADELAGKGGAA
jgi:hypothetical protein